MDKNRKTAFLALKDIETKNSYSNLALNYFIEEEKPDSPAFVRELVYGVLERKLWLDYVLCGLLANPKSRIKPSDRTLLRMGIYQLKYMDSVPDYAAVDGCVRLAKQFCRGRDGFINGVLRSYLKVGKNVDLPDEGREPVEHLSIKYSCGSWIVRLWLSQYGREFTEKLLAAGNERPVLTIRANGMKISREKLCSMLREEGFTAEYGAETDESINVSGSRLLSGKLYEEGFFSVQDESSMLAVCELDPQPGEAVVDVCAAPGGKSLFVAERMKNKGRVYSRDVYDTKLGQLVSEAGRLGISIVETKVHDGEKTDEELVGKADRVLVDAPCSGLGVIRRKPEIKYKEQEAGDVLLPEKQLRILTASAPYVKPGGVLVYSTCTVNRQENENIIEQFLKENSAFTVEKQRQIFPFEGNLDGFFICRMKRNL